MPNEITNWQLSWEVSQSVFSSASALKGLIAAAGHDDIQPQAILAAEALGAGLLVSSQRIPEAIEALGGGESNRMAAVKAYVGLSSGAIFRQVRQNTALIQFFALITACKPCFLDEEIGSIIFEMLQFSGLLRKWPATSTQLTALIQQFSGHAEILTPVSLMHELASTIAGRCRTPLVYHRLEASALSNLLVKVFEAMQDTTITRVTLIGHHQAVWLSTALLWLLEDQTCILIDDEILAGRQEARLNIHIEVENVGPWTVQLWKQGAVDPTSYIESIPQSEERTSLLRQPLVITRTYVETILFSGYPDPMHRRILMELIGDLACVFIRILFERGNVQRSRDCCKQKLLRSSDMDACAKIGIKDIANVQWIENIPNIITRYGWRSSNQDRINNLVSIIFDILPAKSISRAENPDRLPHQAPEVETIKWETAWFDIKEVCLKFVRQHCDVPDSIIANVMNAIYFVAYDAVITSTCDLQGCVRYVRQFGETMPDTPKELLYSLLARQMGIEEFLALALRQVLTNREDFRIKDGDLVLTSNGQVAGSSLLWNPIADQRVAAGIRVMKGCIRDDLGSTYECIREAPLKQKVVREQMELVEIHRGHREDFPSIHVPDWDCPYKFQSEVTTLGKRLELRFYIHLPGGHPTQEGSLEPPTRRRVSWLEAAHAIATAKHINPWDLPASIQKELAERLYHTATTKPMYWTHPFELSDVQEDHRTIMVTHENELVRVFGAMCPLVSDHCSRLVIRHGGTLLQCIEAASRSGPRWTLVM